MSNLCKQQAYHEPVGPVLSVAGIPSWQREHVRWA